MTQFDYHDFASESPMPADHHNAQSLYCFYNDPYVYYRTYVQEVLEKPPIIARPVDMLYKYFLLKGEDSFISRFDSYSPINYSTRKPYGEDTQKYANWAKEVRQDGKIPIHPLTMDRAKIAYEHTMEQVEDGFAPDLKAILDAGGHAGIQDVALIDDSRCYAHVDYLTNTGTVCKVALVSSLDRFMENNQARHELVFKLAYDNLVLSKSTKTYTLFPPAKIIIAEYNAPFRVATTSVDTGGLVEAVITETIQQLNKSFNATETNSQWASKYASLSGLFFDFSMVPHSA
jgi:hypothetical protein